MRHVAFASGYVNTMRFKAFFKHVGDKESSWHQDQQAAPLTTDKFVTLWIPLEELDAEQGTLMFASGSHTTVLKAGGKQHRQHGLGSKGLPMSERVASVKHLTDAEVREQHHIVGPRNYRLGDISAHLGWTLHRAPPNTGKRQRKAVALTYFEDGAVVPHDFVHHGTTNDPGVRRLPQSAYEHILRSIYTAILVVRSVRLGLYPRRYLIGLATTFSNTYLLKNPIHDTAISAVAPLRCALTACFWSFLCDGMH